MDIFFHPPLWLSYLFHGIFLFVSLASGAVVLTRAGVSPWFVFVWLVPYGQIIGLWLFAYAAWPKRGT